MNKRTYYPINLDLQQKPCLVIGGGDVASHKAKALLDCGAKVLVISPELKPSMGSLVKSGKVKWIKRGYQEKDLKGIFLIIAATDMPEVNAAVARHAHKRGILINVVDVPKLCNFIVPSVLRRGAVTITISTGGQSPVLAQHIKAECEACRPAYYGTLAKMLGDVREKVKERHATMAERKKVYQKIMNSQVLNLLKNNKRREALALIKKLI